MLSSEAEAEALIEYLARDRGPRGKCEGCFDCFMGKRLHTTCGGVWCLHALTCPAHVPGDAEDAPDDLGRVMLNDR